MTVDQLPGISSGDVDPLANPDMANAIGAMVMNEDPIDKPVLIADPPDGTVTLPGGLVIDGELVREAQVRELNGEDEETLAKPGYAKDFIKLMDGLLSRCVISIGDKRASRELLDQLLIGDRDMLLQAIRVATYGDNMRMNLTCPGCENEMKVEYRFSRDVEIRHLDGHTVELADGEHGVTLSSEQRLYMIPLRKGGNALVSLITGYNQRYVYNSENAKLTTPERNSLLLQQCVLNINGEPPMPADIRRLSSGDRDQILRFLVQAQPGPLWGEVKQSCPACDREFPLVIDVPTMFRGL